MLRSTAPRVMVKFPSAQDRRDIDQDLRLDADASSVLWHRVRQIVDDIERHQAHQTEIAQGRNRADQIRFIRALSRQLTMLELHLAGGDRNTDALIRTHLAPRLGEIVSHSGFERLIQRSPGYALGSHFPPLRVGLRSDGLLRAQEEELQGRRIDLAHQTAPRLLKALVHDLNAPLLRFLAIERGNRGGAPSKIYRNYTVDQLADIHQSVYGSSPTRTLRGPFVELCEAVVAAIGLDTEGLDQAAARILRRRKAS